MMPSVARMGRRIFGAKASEDKPSAAMSLDAPLLTSGSAGNGGCSPLSASYGASAEMIEAKAVAETKVVDSIEGYSRLVAEGERLLSEALGKDEASPERFKTLNRSCNAFNKAQRMRRRLQEQVKFGKQHNNIYYRYYKGNLEATYLYINHDLMEEADKSEKLERFSAIICRQKRSKYRDEELTAAIHHIIRAFQAVYSFCPDNSEFKATSK